MPNPLVTIGIPCFNCSRYLPLLMRSIEVQTYDNWEVVAIDDGSSDSTRDILRAMEGPRVHVVVDDQNRGLSYRLNQIADLARGALIARTDADDLLLPARIERQVKVFQEDPSTDVVSTGCYVVDNHNHLVGVRRIPALARTAREVMLRNGPSHPTVMTTRAWAQDNRYRCESRRGEDLDLWIRTIERSRIRFLPEPLHVIREDPQFDHAKYQRTIRDHQRVVGNHLEEIGDPWLSFIVRTRLLARACGYRAGHLLGISGAMAARRNAPLPEEEVRKVEKILAELGVSHEAVMTGAS